MNIVSVTSELYPYSGTGGLSDMVAGLGKTLAKKGHKIRYITPLYQAVKDLQLPLHLHSTLGPIYMGSYPESVTVYTLAQPNDSIVYFISHPVFDRPGLYQWQGVDYSDNAYRFLLFSKAALELCNAWGPNLDVIHLHDWHTAMIALLLQHQSNHNPTHTYKPITCFTIHNAEYQGVFDVAVYQFTNLPWDYFTMEGVEFYGKVNFLKAGIGFADAITTVSPRYAREILTPEFGAGLEGYLQAHASKLAGILNGIDIEEWDPETDPWIRHHYNAHNLAPKLACKQDLQMEVGFPIQPDTPLFASIMRLTEQKGISILLPAIETVLSHHNIQFILVGNGNPHVEAAFKNLAQRFPQKFHMHSGFNRALSHRVEAGADFFVLPSRYEPCGLNQMYSQRYGTLPIVRRVGGLDDTVIDIADDPARGTGIKFTDYSPKALIEAIERAISLFNNKQAMEYYRRNAMHQDFSWDRSASAYETLYARTIRRLKQPALKI